jgi:Fe-S-cluster-containing hydrogenase component 2
MRLRRARSLLRWAAPEVTSGPYRELRQLPLFDGLPNQLLADGLAKGELVLLELLRDQILARPPETCFVVAGQLSWSQFDPAQLAGLTRATAAPHKARSDTPARSARRHLLRFGAGDLFRAAQLPGGGAATALCALMPTRLIGLKAGRLRALTGEFPFFAERVRQAQARMAVEAPERLDFLVRHGLTVASTLRVRHLDRCIECKQCEIACAERYGSSRLHLGGPRLGVLDFVLTCRTCVDQRCLDGCAFDAIAYDPARGEVVIDEGRCTGSGVCARLCPYGAIEMVELRGASPRLVARLADAGAPVAKLRRTAQKCNHCADYADQACVTRCPTGALVELRPDELEQAAPTDHARLPPRRVSPRLYWGAALFGFVPCLAEIVLRRRAPGLTLGYLARRYLDGLEPELARATVDYKAGCTLSLACGFLGSALILLTLPYILRQHIRALERFGSNQSWFDFHVMCGIMGPAFIVLHTAGRLDNWVASAFWSMVVVVASGLVGRYLMTFLPKAVHGREPAARAHELALVELEPLYPQAVASARSRWQLLSLRRHTPSLAMAWRIAGHAAVVARHRRRLAFMPRAQAIVLLWKRIHLPFAVVMALLVALHVALALKFGS